MVKWGFLFGLYFLANFCALAASGPILKYGEKRNAFALMLTLNNEMGRKNHEAAQDFYELITTGKTDGYKFGFDQKPTEDAQNALRDGIKLLPELMENPLERLEAEEKALLATYGRIPRYPQHFAAVKKALAKAVEDSRPDPSKLVTPPLPLTDGANFRESLHDDPERDGEDAGKYLTETSIPYVMEAAKISKKNASFTIKKLPTGSYSNAVFLVEVQAKDLEDPSQAQGEKSVKYVIKCIKDKSGKIASRDVQTAAREAQELQRLNQNPLVHFIKENRYLPNITTDIQTYFYIDDEGGKQFIAIMRAAQGEELADFMWTYIVSEKDFSEKEAAFMMNDFGASLGRLQLIMADEAEKAKADKGELPFKTAVHRDLNPHNVFWNRNTRKFTLIDCAELAESFNEPDSSFFDLDVFYVFVKYKLFISEDAADVKCKTYARLNGLFDAFARGYARVFDRNVGNSVYKEVIQRFKNISVGFAQELRRHSTAKFITLPLRDLPREARADPWRNFLSSLVQDKVLSYPVGAILNKGLYEKFTEYVLADPWAQLPKPTASKLGKAQPKPKASTQVSKAS